jgi:hypothetical protein
MDAHALLAELAALGVEVHTDGDSLKIRPAEAVPPKLRAELRARKPELVRHLTAPAVADPLGGVSPVLPCERAAAPSALVAEVCAMRLDDFARAGLVVAVWSEVLSERVIFASDNAVVDPGELRPVYRARELRVLLGMTNPDELRAVNNVKKTFRGTITDSSGAMPECRAAEGAV